MHLSHEECVKFKWEGVEKNGAYFVFGPFENNEGATTFLEQVVKKNHPSEIAVGFAYHPKNHLGYESKEAYLKVYVK